MAPLDSATCEFIRIILLGFVEKPAGTTLFQVAPPSVDSYSRFSLKGASQTSDPDAASTGSAYEEGATPIDELTA